MRSHSDYNRDRDRDRSSREHWDEDYRYDRDLRRQEGGLRRVPLSSYFKDPQSRWDDDNEPHRRNEYHGAPGADRDWEGDRDIPGSRGFTGNRSFTYAPHRHDRDRTDTYWSGRHHRDSRHEERSHWPESRSSYEDRYGRSENRLRDEGEGYNRRDYDRDRYDSRSSWNDSRVSRNQHWHHHDSDLGSRNQHSHHRWPEDPYARLIDSRYKTERHGNDYRNERRNDDYRRRSREDERNERNRNRDDINYWRREQEGR